MKRIIFLTIVMAAFLASCEKDEIGGTATEKVAGTWSVSVDAVDAAGEVVFEDFFGIGHFNLLTYNTVKNVPTELWVDDGGNFWEFKVVVDLDYGAGLFSTKDFVDNHAYDSQVKISGGKVLYGAATTPSGMPADSIVFYVSFDDDTYPDDYGYENYKVSGYRYTGLANDE
jgi:hypothetical protein